MKRLIGKGIACLWLLGAASAFATPAQDQVQAKFAALLKKQVQTMIDLARTASQGKMDEALAQLPEAQREALRKQMEQALGGWTDAQTDQLVSQAMEAFQPELTVSDDEAQRLLTDGPDDAKNRARLDADKKVLVQSPLPKPELLTGMMDQPDGTKGWDLELLRRLADGTVRQLKERDAAKP